MARLPAQPYKTSNLLTPLVASFIDINAGILPKTTKRDADGCSRGQKDMPRIYAMDLIRRVLLAAEACLVILATLHSGHAAATAGRLQSLQCAVDGGCEQGDAMRYLRPRRSALRDRRVLTETKFNQLRPRAGHSFARRPAGPRRAAAAAAFPAVHRPALRPAHGDALDPRAGAPGPRPRDGAQPQQRQRRRHRRRRRDLLAPARDRRGLGCGRLLQRPAAARALLPGRDAQLPADTRQVGGEAGAGGVQSRFGILSRVGVTRRLQAESDLTSGICAAAALL
ncbi:hypothetical protein PWT90_00150 [Aphanocladium album]|nr:hypothetical protein PWT90_00150 [Aphanocladium album]